MLQGASAVGIRRICTQKSVCIINSQGKAHNARVASRVEKANWLRDQQRVQAPLHELQLLLDALAAPALCRALGAPLTVSMLRIHCEQSQMLVRGAAARKGSEC